MLKILWIVFFLIYLAIQPASCQPGCAVLANFSTSDTTVSQNTFITIKNQSAGALSYKWYLNNQFISAGQDFANTFSSAGAYTIKLIASNNTCSDEKLITVIVLQPCFQPAFQKIFHSPHKENISQVYNMPDESMIVIGSIVRAGRTDSDALMMKVDRRGKLLWAKCYGGDADDAFSKVVYNGDAGKIIAIGHTKSFGDAAGSAWAVGINLFGILSWSQVYYDNTSSGIVFNDLVKFGNSVAVAGTYHKNTADADALFMQLYGFDGRVFARHRFANSDADEALAIGVGLNIDTIYLASASKAGAGKDIIITKINRNYLQPYQSKRIHIANSNLEPISLFYTSAGLLINAVAADVFGNNPKQLWINNSTGINLKVATVIDHGLNAKNYAAHSLQNGILWNGSSDGNKLNLSAHTNNVTAGKTFSYNNPVSLAGIAINTDSTLSTASNISVNGNNDILLTKTTLDATNYGCTTSDLATNTTSLNAELVNDGWESVSDFSYNTETTPGLVTTDLNYIIETLCEAPECITPANFGCSAETFFKTYADDYNMVGFRNVVVRGNDLLTIGGVTSEQGAGVTSISFNGDINYINKYGSSSEPLTLFDFIKDSKNDCVYFAFRPGNYNSILFKTDPTGKIIWSNSYKLPFGTTSRVIECADGNYLIAFMASHFPGFSSLISIKVNKNDGSIIWQREHATGRYSPFVVDIKLAGGKILMFANSAGGPYPRTQCYLFVLDDATGNPLASREFASNEIDYFPSSITLMGNKYLLGSRYINNQDNFNNGFFFAILDENFNLQKSRFINIENRSEEFSVIKTGVNEYIVNTISYDISTGNNQPQIFCLDSSLNIVWIRKSKPNINGFLYPASIGELPDKSFVSLGFKSYSTLMNEFINGFFAKYTKEGALLGCLSEQVSFYYPSFLQPISNFSLSPLANPTVASSPITIPFGSAEPLKINSVKCNMPSACTFVKITGFDTVCINNKDLSFKIKRNINCISPIIWNTDTAYVKVTGYSDSSMTVSFIRQGNTKIYASLDAGCAGILKDSIELTIISSFEKFTLGADTTMCNGNNIVLHAPKNYKLFSWQNGSTDSIFTVTKPGTYFIDLIDYCNNKSADTINVRIDTSLLLTLPPTISHCSNDTLFVPADSGFDTYTWSPDYFISNANTKDIKIYAPKDTTYFLKATKIKGCTAYDTIKIITKDPLRFSLGEDTSICKNQPLLLNLPASLSNILWSTGSTDQSILVSAPGKYSVRAKDAIGCSIIDSLQVLQVFDSTYFSAGNDTSICLNKPLSLSVPLGFLNYKWNTGSSTNTLTVKQPGKYFVSATDKCNYKYSDTVIVSIDSASTLTLPAQLIHCNNDTLTITADIGFDNYLWSPNYYADGVTARTIKIFAPTDTVYMIMATKNKGCTALDTIRIKTIKPQIFSLGNDTTICKNQPITLSIPAAFTNIEWSTGSSANNITASDAGFYVVKGVDLNGCNSSDTLEIIDALNVNFDLGNDTSICSNKPFTLSAPAGFASYSWNNGSNSNTIVVSEKGMYSVTATGNNSVCSGTDSILILNVYEPPVDFLNPTDIMCMNTFHTLTSLQSFKTYLWNTQATSSSIIVQKGGLYWLKVTDKNNCVNTDSIFIQEKICNPTIYFPNAFTPNTDNKNDLFKATVTQAPEIFKLAIYNRFGKRIFESTNPTNGWNGTINGIPQPAGAYAWKASYKFPGDKLQQANGLFVLLR